MATYKIHCSACDSNYLDESDAARHGCAYCGAGSKRVKVELTTDYIWDTKQRCYVTVKK